MDVTFSLPCVLCGEPITVDEATVKLAANSEFPLRVQHDTCVKPKGAPRTFRVEVTVHEIIAVEGAGPVLMGKIGQTLTAEGFPTAVNGPITDWLNAQWPKFQESAPFADMSSGPPAPPPAPLALTAR